MDERIYDFTGKNILEFPDVTVLLPEEQISGSFILTKVNPDTILFPEASNYYGAAKALKDVLTDMRSSALEDRDFVPELSSVRQFGIQPGVDDVVQEILNRYVKVCLEKFDTKQGFGPGIQFDYYQLTQDGIEVTLGNYGLFGATLLEASADPAYKQFLIERGVRDLGSRQGFFHNPPATNTVVRSKDGYYLFSFRGPTAEYKNMLHQVAAGHHSPESLWDAEYKNMIHQIAAGHFSPEEIWKNEEIPDDMRVVDIYAQTDRQIATETGVSEDKVEGHKFIGVAFSTGYQITSTEKSEVLTKAVINVLAKDVPNYQKDAPHHWETKRIIAVHPDNIKVFIMGTSDSSKAPYGLEEVLGVKDSAKVGLLPDPNSVTYMVPVGWANSVLGQGEEFYEHFLQR